MRDAQAGRFSHLLVWALDRLSRQGSEASLRLVRRFEELGVRVVSLQEPWLESSGDSRELLIAVAGHTARTESQRRGERVKAARERLRAAERWPGGSPPFAYRVAENGSLVVVPERAEIVKEIFRIYLHERLGIDRIQRELRVRGVPSPRGSVLWSRVALIGLLRESAYANGVHEPTGTPAEAFIPVEQWKRAQELLRANRRLHLNRSGRPWPLADMRCARCGSRFGTDSGGTRIRKYFDRGSSRNSPFYLRTGSLCNAVPRLPAAMTESQVLRALTETFRDPTSFIRALDSTLEDLMSRGAELNIPVGDVQSALAKIERQRNKLARQWLADALPDDEVESVRRDLDERQRELEARLALLDPDQVAELDRTTRMLDGATHWRAVAERRADRGMSMRQFDCAVEYAETDELLEFRSSGILPLRMPAPDAVPDVLGKWLNRLHAEVYARVDRIEVRGLVSFESPRQRGDTSSFRQPSQPGRGLG